MIPAAGRTSLRRRLSTAAVATAALVAVGVPAILVTNSRLMQGLAVATDRVIEEQRIADRVGQAVVRQLVAASTGASEGDLEAREAFDEAGREVYDLIQEYLFRSLSPEERLQLETIKRQHQRLEVAAVEAAGRDSRGDPEAAAAARATMFRHASSLLEDLELFMRMRGEGLKRLREQERATFRVLFAGALAVAVALLVGSLLAGGFLYRRVSHPLARLAAASERLGAGDLAARIEVEHHDEIGVVAASFNRMAGSLSAARERLQAQNEELAGALEDLRSTQEELVQAEKMSALGRMTAGMAHELNNPLASVLAHAELLSRELEEEPAPDAANLREDFVRPLVEEATRARALVRNLLDFSRKADRDHAPAELGEALDIVVGLRDFAFRREGLDLVLEPLPETWVRADRNRLQEVFLNIVNNALEAMVDAGVTDGNLTIHGHVEDGRVRLCFDDEGPGFEAPERAFEPFHTTKPPGRGTGLGLTLVHRFVEEVGGSVEATAAPVGGARVVVELPVCPRPAPDAPVVRPGGRRVPPGAAGGAAGVAGAEGPAPVVLIVEDEPHLRRVQARLVRRLGAVPRVAVSGREAREILEGKEGDGVDAVVSDVRMADGDGIELFRWVESHRPELAERFLFVTGDVYGEETRELAAARPELFVQKPFEMDDYLERISAALGRGRPDGASTPAG